MSSEQIVRARVHDISDATLPAPATTKTMSRERGNCLFLRVASIHVALACARMYVGFLVRVRVYGCNDATLFLHGAARNPAALVQAENGSRKKGKFLFLCAGWFVSAQD